MIQSLFERLFQGGFQIGLRDLSLCMNQLLVEFVDGLEQLLDERWRDQRTARGAESFDGSVRLLDAYRV